MPKIIKNSPGKIAPGNVDENNGPINLEMGKITNVDQMKSKSSTKRGLTINLGDDLA